MTDFKDFAPTADWYAREYHKEILGDDPPPPGLGEHHERDEACLREVGLLPGHKILQVGCGGGNNLLQIANIFPDVRNITAIDFSPPAVKYCKKHFPYIEAIVADATFLPFPDNTFDRVLALDVTEHMPFGEYICFLFHAYCVLKPGGVFVVLPGLTKRKEHVNLLTPKTIAHHLGKVRFHKIIQRDKWVLATK